MKQIMVRKYRQTNEWEPMEDATVRFTLPDGATLDVGYTAGGRLYVMEANHAELVLRPRARDRVDIAIS